MCSMTELTDADGAGDHLEETLDEIDVRQIDKPLRHPLIFKRFAELAVGGSFILVNNHDPKHLRQEFERDHPGAYEWTYLDTDGDRRLFRIRIARRTATDVPQVLGNTHDLLKKEPSNPDIAATLGGAIWKLASSQRQLDSNIIRLAAHDRIHPHNGPEQDVLLHVLSGSGQVISEGGASDLTEGSLAWLPRRSRRSIIAGADGLSYLSVHTRRPGLSIATLGD